MTQLDLIHESIRDAVRSAIAAQGGIKKVASSLRPSWEPDRAQKWLSNAIDDTRPEKLEIEDYIYIFRGAKEIGYHGAMDYFAAECGYEAKAVEAETELAKLQRQYIDAVKALQSLTPKIDAAKLRIA